MCTAWLGGLCTDCLSLKAPSWDWYGKGFQEEAGPAGWKGVLHLTVRSSFLPYLLLSTVSWIPGRELVLRWWWWQQWKQGGFRCAADVPWERLMKQESWQFALAFFSPPFSFPACLLESIDCGTELIRFGRALISCNPIINPQRRVFVNMCFSHPGTCSPLHLLINPQLPARARSIFTELRAPSF